MCICALSININGNVNLFSFKYKSNRDYEGKLISHILNDFSFNNIYLTYFPSCTRYCRMLTEICKFDKLELTKLSVGYYR